MPGAVHETRLTLALRTLRREDHPGDDAVRATVRYAGLVTHCQQTASDVTFMTLENETDLQEIMADGLRAKPAAWTSESWKACTRRPVETRP